MHEVECSVYEAMNRSVVHFCKLMSSLSRQQVWRIWMRVNTDVGSGKRSMLRAIPVTVAPLP